MIAAWHGKVSRRHLFLHAVLVGLLAGGLAVAFRWTLEGGEVLREHLIAWAHHVPVWGWLVPLLAGALGASLAVGFVRHLAPEASGSGIPHVKLALERFRPMRWQRLIPVKFLGGALAISGGLALGREGPTVQMGGAVGAAVAARLRVTPRERQTLIATGAGAGLAAAFNAPLAGLIFVLEELHRHFAPTVFGAAFVAAMTADVVTRSLTDQLPVFHVNLVTSPSLRTLPAFLVLGVLAGLLGVIFNQGLLGSLRVMARLGRRRSRVATWVWRLSGVLVGTVVGGVGWYLPQALGGGQHLVDMALRGQIALAQIPWWFGLRLSLTLLSYGCGAPGGIFAPLLVLGALLGLAVGDVAQALLPGQSEPLSAFAVVGMASYFAAIVRAPLTGMVLIIEMTNSYALILPLFLACFAAYTVADVLRDAPIYDALMTRDRQRDGETPRLDEPLVAEFILQEGARFDGQYVHALGLPEGCLLVALQRGDAELVPTAHTRLEGGMRLTVVLAPQAVEALGLLKDGCTQRRQTQ